MSLFLFLLCFLLLFPLFLRFSFNKLFSNVFHQNMKLRGCDSFLSFPFDMMNRKPFTNYCWMSMDNWKINFCGLYAHYYGRPTRYQIFYGHYIFISVTIVVLFMYFLHFINVELKLQSIFNISWTCTARKQQNNVNRASSLKMCLQTCVPWHS